MNLNSFYQLMYTLKSYHNFNIDEIENMIPWEREVFVNLIAASINKEEEPNG